MKEKEEIVKNISLLEKGGSCCLFGTFLGSLGAVGSLLDHFLEPLGHLGHQKSPKGGPKAPKGLPKGCPAPPPFYAISGKLGSVVFYENVKKRYLKNIEKNRFFCVRKCP